VFVQAPSRISINTKSSETKRLAANKGGSPRSKLLPQAFETSSAASIWPGIDPVILAKTASDSASINSFFGPTQNA
jgi:hypothetical protein